MTREELIITNEDVELLKEMKNNCLKADAFNDEKRLLKANAITKFLMLQQENKELQEKINTYENPADLTLMFMYCDEKAKDKIKELQQEINKIMEIIELNQYSYGYQIKEEILEG